MAIFFPNKRLAEDLKKEPDYQAAIHGAAAQLAESVRQATPEGATGAAREGIEVAQLGEDTVVAQTDFAGHLIEWGSRNNPPYAPLRRGAQAAGFRLVERH